MLPREYRLRKIHYLTLKRGKKIKTTYFLLFYKENDIAQTRVGVTITKKIGKAAFRNKIKRRILSAIEHDVRERKKGIDVVIIPSQYVKNWEDVSFEAIHEDLYNALSKL